MDYPRGRTHSCQQCEAEFTKQYLLQQHQRLLNHHTTYTCNVCQKSFTRKDNLTRHQLRHQDGTSYQCPHCGKLFSRQEQLNEHRQQHYVQYGGALKRPAENYENEDTPPKKRLTKESNPQNFYTIQILKETQIPKFHTKSTNYRITFKELEVKSLPEILRTLKILFQSIIDNITHFIDKTDLVRLSVECPELDFPITVPFIKLRELNADRILSEIERVLQSYEQFVLDETLEIELIHVKLPTGGVGKRCHYVDLEKMMKDKKCFIRIANQDNLCCARALVTARARIEGHEKWSSIKQGRNIQKELAVSLHQEAGVPLAKCGLEEIRRFQECMPNYQINVISKEHFNGIIFSGPQTDKQIYIYHHDEHYDVITSMSAFLSKSYFCIQCKTGYDHVSRHKCNNPCVYCHHIHEDGIEQWMQCPDCNRNFRNNVCFDKHKQCTRSGNSTCGTYYKCKSCDQLVNKSMHKKEHRCGESYCKTCKDFFESGHKCYMLPVTSKDDKFNTYSNVCDQNDVFIYFDFECTQDDLYQCEKGYFPDENDKCRYCRKSFCGSYEHKPNLCVAQKVCSLCINQPITSASECVRCSKNEVVYSGENTAEDFCRWLLSEKHYGAKVFCHNFKGYDSYWILKYLYDNAILPEVISTGSKYMSIYIQQCKMRFLDSLNFLPMALADLPEAFNLTELRKGYFPHLFNRKENHNKVFDSLPDVKFYNPDGMKPDKRTIFMDWYSEHKDDSFDFQKEILQYCKSDVDILRQSCLKFREMFMEITEKNGMGIDPFESCITIASACNLVFRTNFLESDSLGIIPTHGYRPQQKQSNKAIQWLKYISYNKNIDIQHAMNKGEMKIGPYAVDGFFDNELGEKTVWEFHGCFWHGCTKCFARTTQNPVTECSMADLHQRTLDKRKYIEDRGYTYISIWECDFDEQIRENKHFRNFVESLDIVSPLEPRDAFFGGRTEVFTLFKEAENGESIKYYDVTSLYPFINKTGTIPLGHPVIITENFKDISQYEGLIKCKVIPPKNLYIPVLPLKVNGKLLFPLCRTCAENYSQQKCLHTEEQRSFTGTWVSDELKTAVEQGYVLKQLYEVWHFENTSKYDQQTKSGGIFTEYINTFLTLKQEASGWPEWCQTEDDRRQYIDDYYEKEGIWLDPSKIRRNPGLRSLAKLMLNSFWGKFGQRSNLTQTKYITEPAEYFDMMTSDSQIIKNVRFVSKEMVHMDWIYLDDFVEVSGRTNVVVAAYTTAQARLKLYEYLKNLNTRALYCDTDSVIFISKPGEWEPKRGDYLGEMTDELLDKNGENSIRTFIGAGPKNYAFKLARPDKKGYSTKCVVKGISLNYKNALDINFDTVKDMITGQKTKSVTIENNKIVRDKNTSTILTTNEKKDYRIVFDKRVIRENYKTEPYGM